MGDIDPIQEGAQESVEQPIEQDDGISEVEGFVDPFEDDWDDAEMKKSLNEWERMLADSDAEMINSLQPGASASPPTASTPTPGEMIESES